MPSFNLSINPPQLELVVKPGASLTQAYQITNNSDNTILLETSIAPWQPSGIEGAVSYRNIDHPPGIKFSLNNADLKLGQTFVLQPKSSRQLVLKIQSDSHTLPQDYYFTFFISQPQNQLNTTQATGKIGSHVLMSFSSAEELLPKANIINFKSLPYFKDIFLTPINFQAEIENTTDYFFKTTGKITLEKNNLKIKELELLPQNVLNHHVRKITCQDSQQCTVRPPFWPGKYSATLELDPTISATPTTITFFVFPFSIFIPIIIISMIIFTFIKKIK